MLRFSPCLFRWTTHHSESSRSRARLIFGAKKTFWVNFPPPQLIIHCGHTKSKHLHQLAFALIPFIAASEPWSRVPKWHVPSSFFGLGWAERGFIPTSLPATKMTKMPLPRVRPGKGGELRKGKLQTFSGRWLPVVRVCAHVWDPFQRNSAPEKPVRSTRWLWITMGYFHPLSVW